MLEEIFKTNLNVRLCVMFYHVCAGLGPCGCCCGHQAEADLCPSADPGGGTVSLFHPDARPCCARTVDYVPRTTSGSAGERRGCKRGWTLKERGRGLLCSTPATATRKAMFPWWL